MGIYIGVSLKKTYLKNLYLVPFSRKFEDLINPLRPNNDLSQTSHCNIKGLSVSEVMRIENEITPVKFY